MAKLKLTTSVKYNGQDPFENMGAGRDRKNKKKKLTLVVNPKKTKKKSKVKKSPQVVPPTEKGLIQRFKDWVVALYVALKFGITGK